MLNLRLDGFTYADIARKAGISRQRVQKILSPPREIRMFVVNKYSGQCANCGIHTGFSGHLHHNGDCDEESYMDIENLQLLCISCHRGKHINLEKKYRDTNLIRYRQQHPDITVRALAAIFKISKSRVHQILKKEQGVKNE